MGQLALTYTSLKSTLQSFLVENAISLSSQDYTANIDTIIQMGEEKLVRDLDLDIFDVDATAATANGVETLTKPTGYLAPRTLRYTVSGAQTFLLPRTVEYVRDYGGSGNPLYYAELTDTTWALAPVPTSTITVNVRYVKRPVSIVTTSPSWMGTNAGDALLYACLIASEEFLKDETRGKVWKDKYETDILPRTKQELKRLQRSDY